MTEHYDYIKTDDYKGVSIAIEYLIKLGHRRIAYIGDMQSKLRLKPYIDTLNKNNISVHDDLIRLGEERFEEGGYERMSELLDLEELPTAVFASYDDVAIGAMKAIYERNLKIPEDISIIGLDNINVSSYLYRPLTTISQPLNEMGEIATRILLDKIGKKNSAIQHVVLQPQLIIRETTGEIQ